MRSLNSVSASTICRASEITSVVSAVAAWASTTATELTGVMRWRRRMPVSRSVTSRIAIPNTLPEMIVIVNSPGITKRVSSGSPRPNTNPNISRKNSGNARDQ